MVSDSSVTGHILSSVVPANVTGDLLHELTGVDLAFKLHYLRAVYYFKPSEAVERLTIWQMKEPMFLMLGTLYTAAGRIRRHETGRPYIKCNDSGVRTVEANAATTVEEWMEMEEVDRAKHLVYDRVLGPDLAFSPQVYLQFTRFKCGGLAIGLSWAHVLGDAVSASNSLNLWTHILNTNQPPTKIQHQKETDNKITLPITENPRSLKKVEPVGDFWLPSTSLKMATFSFKISESKLGHLQSKMSGHVQAFEAISAVVWQSLAKIRAGKEPNLITILRNDTSEERKYVLGNKQIISTVSIDSSVAKLELSELAMLMRNSDKDEKKSIADIVDKGDGKEDFIIYGANLTFADMQGVDLYGLELKGQKPAYVDYSIHGVGEEGAILVLPAPDESGTGGRALTVILPEDEILKLKEVLASEWSIA